MAILGAATGYGVWLLGGAVIILTTPVHLWAVATAILVAGIAAGSFAAARRYRDRPGVAAALWSAPLLPVLASVYLLFTTVAP